MLALLYETELLWEAGGNGDRLLSDSNLYPCENSAKCFATCVQVCLSHADKKTKRRNFWLYNLKIIKLFMTEKKFSDIH